MSRNKYKIFFVVFLIIFTFAIFNNLRVLITLADMANHNAEFFAFQDKLIDLNYSFGIFGWILFAGAMTTNLKTLIYIGSFSLITTGIIGFIIYRNERIENEVRQDVLNDINDRYQRDISEARRKHQDTITRFKETIEHARKFKKYHESKVRELEKHLYKTAETHMPVYVLLDLSSAPLGDIFVAARSKEEATEMVFKGTQGSKSSRKFAPAVIVPDLVYLSNEPKIIETPKKI